MKKTSSSFAFIEVLPGKVHKKAYSKKSDKYYYVVSGKLLFNLEGQEHKLNKGDFCIVPQGKIFNYKNVTNELVELILVHTPSFDLNEEIFI